MLIKTAYILDDLRIYIQSMCFPEITQESKGVPPRSRQLTHHQNAFNQRSINKLSYPQSGELCPSLPEATEFHCITYPGCKDDYSPSRTFQGILLQSSTLGVPD
ncbi:hypothetical protein NPIL_366721 [Nephila pilipes]|uniref:Uncharacterized protein n=1 Tax=Nephila pilipes TaxID=299642 RepID=A0A8X6QJ15_NEPPI|nr:hypothetical protein NPIL_366721 [Nephila pilipes]